MQKLQSVLGVKAFEIRGRKAVLTTTGQLLYRRARALLAMRAVRESRSHALGGLGSRNRLVMEVIFPGGSY